ncbi:MAG: serine/threonine protein kinase [Rhodanobacteraceae bacterium]|nr:serine/threonine protein kinase [Rhodanobacteraceae bacterium]
MIGEGGNGRVYLAERQDLGGRAAVKLLRGRFTGPDITRRFHAEQVILARLDHPNIAHLLQVGVAEDGTPWLAMEYVEGQPFLQGLAAMSVRQRLRVILKLLDAVDHAHGQLVVHRDIKPGNILIDQRGEPRLLDFGIAKRLDDAGAQLTHTDSHPRTPAYAAPEQVRGEPISVATDVYALGVLLFESLTGSKPWNLAGMQLDAAALEGLRGWCLRAAGAGARAALRPSGRKIINAENAKSRGERRVAQIKDCPCLSPCPFCFSFAFSASRCWLQLTASPGRRGRDTRSLLLWEGLQPRSGMRSAPHCCRAEQVHCAPCAAASGSRCTRERLQRLQA